LALFTKDSIERVREAVDMVELVGAKTDLRRAGSRWQGLCPFHDERTPSFSVNPEDKLYYCFGCQKGGDAIGFLQEVDGLDFQEAIETLAERYNVRLEREDEDPEADRKRKERDRLLGLLDRTANFYASYLGSSGEAAKARAYLTERGFTDETLHEFRVGYSPSAWDRVLTGAQRDGYSPQELLDAGLAQRNQTGNIYDRFRGRIMFPLADLRGRVLGFGARAMADSRPPKYLNSSESRIYRKGRQLFGIDVARSHATKSGRIVVVEGYTDVLAMHQAGIKETVAIMGTALTEDQVVELSKVAKRVILALDADRAGQEAMLRAARLAKDRDLDLGAVEMPEGADPAELLQKGGSEAMNGLLERARGMIEFQVHRVLADAELDTPAGRDRALESARRLIADVPKSSVLKEELVRTVADRLDLPTNLVLAEVPRSRDTVRPTRITRSPGQIALGPEEAFLASCLASEETGLTMLQEISPDVFSSQVVRAAREHLIEHFHDPLAGLAPEETELGQLVARVVDRAGREPGVSAASLRLDSLRLEQRRIEREMRSAIGQDRGRLAAARQDVRREMDAVMGQMA
jgi:DNA primase